MKPILIIDEEAIVRESIKHWLVDAGYQVSVAESSEEALTIMEKGKFGFVILDFRLDGETGIDTVRVLKSIDADIKAIVIKGGPNAVTELYTNKMGVADYLIQPVFIDELEDLIIDVLDRAKNRTENVLA